MSTLTYLTSLVQQAISRLNNYEANAKKVDELPHQTTLEPTSKIQVSRAGISEHLTVQQIISSIQNSNYNQLLAVGTITVDGTDITVPSGVSGQINGLLYGTSTDTILSITLCPTGFSRKDIIVLTTANTVVVISGEETDGAIVLAPPTPPDTVYITEFDVNDTAIGIPVDPIVGNRFVEKTDFNPYNSNVTGIDAIIPLDPNGYSEIRLTNTGLISIAGYDLSLILGNANAKSPYPGKPFIILNLTGHDVVIKKELPTADYPFYFSEESDLVFPNNHYIYASFDPSGFRIIFKSWVDLSTKADLVDGKVPASQLPSYVDNGKDFIFNNFPIPLGSELAIASDPLSDEVIREIGNVVFDANTNQYIMVYSASPSPYTGGNVRIYYATSPDAKSNTWTKQGVLVDSPNEDPYLTIVGNNYRLLAEKKVGTTGDGIELFTGTSLGALTSEGKILDKLAGTWYALDVSSPVEKIVNGVYYLYFEGRATSSFTVNGISYTSNLGAVGLATSNDGINYTIETEPIIIGSEIGGNNWFTHCVPDDIFEANGIEYMTLHVYNGNTFVCAIYKKDVDGIWKDALNTWVSIERTNSDQTGNGLMIKIINGMPIGFLCLTGNEGIWQSNLNIKTKNNLWYAQKTFANSIYAICPSSTNQIIDAPITTDTVFDLKRDDTSTAGIYKIINNNSDFNLSISPNTDVTVNGSTTDFVIKKQKSAFFYTTSTNVWKAFIIEKEPSLGVFSKNLIEYINPSPSYHTGTVDETEIYKFFIPAKTFDSTDKLIFENIALVGNVRAVTGVDVVRIRTSTSDIFSTSHNLLATLNFASPTAVQTANARRSFTLRGGNITGFRNTDGTLSDLNQSILTSNVFDVNVGNWVFFSVQLNNVGNGIYLDSFNLK